MEFLDPAKKRAHLRRLLIGYCLMAILVGILTTIVVLAAYGFDINRQTGEVIQNSLVFVDSDPDGASINVDGRPQRSPTNTRLNLPAGKYSLELTKTGYRNWQRNLDLAGGSVQRITYVKLFPTTLTPAEAQVLSRSPSLVSQTVDRNRFLMQFPDQLTTFLDYDVNSLVNANPPAPNPVVLPANVLSEPNTTKSLSVVEWSTDNRYVLLKHQFASGFEFVALDRENPAGSVNLNKAFNITPVDVRLRDKKFEQVYILTASPGSLELGDVRTKAITPITKNVLVFKNAGANSLIYSQQASKTDKITVSVRENNKSQLMKEFAADQVVLMDLARFGNSNYYGVGSVNEGKVYLYKDLTKSLSKTLSLKPAPVTILKLDQPSALMFSPGGRFVSLQSGQKFVVFDIETDSQSGFEMKNPITTGQTMKWMDNFRFIYNSTGLVVVADFDGSNQQTLVTADPGLTPIFDHDYKRLYTINPATTKPGQPALFRTDLLLPN